MAVCVRYALETCTASGYLRGKSSNCSDPDCCKDGAMYPQYRCSPPVTADTTASMTIVTFAAGGDGQYHSDDQMLVSLSTGWYDGGSRCNKNITINANGRSVLAMVVDECDSVYGCEAEQNFQPPCGNNVSRGVEGRRWRSPKPRSDITMSLGLMQDFEMRRRM
ncbi:hypothetical protein B296_00022853 [Ensete ventricosum]|uniref:Uncharacterized protein n=1 Tax=Ensete ventricosum TaxID=4639 RepID=A0A426ZA25_ENSVE|nr:hypothetical protein B296_00022853 [Ensete ventricosum]